MLTRASGGDGREPGNGACGKRCRPGEAAGARPAPGLGFATHWPTVDLQAGCLVSLLRWAVSQTLGSRVHADRARVASMPACFSAARPSAPCGQARRLIRPASSSGRPQVRVSNRVPNLRVDALPAAVIGCGVFLTPGLLLLAYAAVRGGGNVRNGVSHVMTELSQGFLQPDLGGKDMVEAEADLDEFTGSCAAPRAVTPAIRRRHLRPSPPQVPSTCFWMPASPRSRLFRAKTRHLPRTCFAGTSHFCTISASLRPASVPAARCNNSVHAPRSGGVA